MSIIETCYGALAHGKIDDLGRVYGADSTCFHNVDPAVLHFGSKTKPAEGTEAILKHLRPVYHGVSCHFSVERVFHSEAHDGGLLFVATGKLHLGEQCFPFSHSLVLARSDDSGSSYYIRTELLSVTGNDTNELDEPAFVAATTTAAAETTHSALPTSSVEPISMADSAASSHDGTTNGASKKKARNPPSAKKERKPKKDAAPASDDHVEEHVPLEAEPKPAKSPEGKTAGRRAGKQAEKKAHDAAVVATTEADDSSVPPLAAKDVKPVRPASYAAALGLVNHTTQGENSSKKTTTAGTSRSKEAGAPKPADSAARATVGVHVKVVGGDSSVIDEAGVTSFFSRFGSVKGSMLRSLERGYLIVDFATASEADKAVAAAASGPLAFGKGGVAFQLSLRRPSERAVVGKPAPSASAGKKESGKGGRARGKAPAEATH